MTISQDDWNAAWDAAYWWQKRERNRQAEKAWNRVTDYLLSPEGLAAIEARLKRNAEQKNQREEG